MTKRKPGKSIPNEARHTVQRLLRLRPDEDAAVRAVATARGVPVSRAVGELALVAGVDRGTAVAADRAGLLARVADLRDSLAAIVRCLEDDGIREEHGDAYEAAKSASARADNAADNARDEMQRLIAKASEVPGMSATIDELRQAHLRGERVAGEP